MLAEGHTHRGFQHDRWARPIAAGDIVPARRDVGRAAATERHRARAIRRATPPSSTRPAISGRAGRTPPTRARPGDLDRGRDHDAGRRGGHGDRDARADTACSKARSSRSTTAPARCWRWSAAYSFARSKFNRATQAYRQLGLDLQAVPLHRGHRSRADADVDARSTRRRRSTPAPGSRRTRPATTTASSTGR